MCRMRDASQSSWKQLRNLDELQLYIKETYRNDHCSFSVQILQSGSGNNILLENGMYIMKQVWQQIRMRFISLEGREMFVDINTDRFLVHNYCWRVRLD